MGPNLGGTEIFSALSILSGVSLIKVLYRGATLVIFLKKYACSLMLDELNVLRISEKTFISRIHFLT